jgi:hypothetical protein
MPDGDRVDRLLTEAGERWRAGQAPTPPLAAVWRPPAPRQRLRSAPLLVAAGLVVVLAAAVVGAGGKPSPSPSRAANGPSAAPTVPGSCPVTLHADAAPLASQVASLAIPGFYAPYGAPSLWALIPSAGYWLGSPSTTGGIFLRTFWYSDRWSITDEPDPAISVSAGRLGGGESVTGGRAVNARSRELGTSMIVALDLPSGGCWQITGTYRDRSLSYVVWVPGGAPTPVPSDAAAIPAEIDGQAVLVGDAARAAFTASTDSTPFLVGGWVPQPVALSCPAILESDPWNPCLVIRLLDAQAGGAASISLFAGSGQRFVGPLPAGSTKALVFRVHTHDAACLGRRADCVFRPVVEALVWSGPIVPGPSLGSADLQAAARTVALTFEEARSTGVWDVAWGYLSPFSQRQLGSERAFIDAETAYNAAGGTSGEVHDIVPVPLFDPADTSFYPPDLAADVEATVDLSRAFVVTITHPDVDGASAGSRTYVVASLSGTEWRIWIVH